MGVSQILSLVFPILSGVSREGWASFEKEFFGVRKDNRGSKKSFFWEKRGS